MAFDNKLKSINLLKYLEKLDKKIFVFGNGIEEYIKENRKELLNLAYSLGYKKSAVQNWTIKNILPAKIFEKVKNKINKKNLQIKSYGNSNLINANLELDKVFLNFCRSKFGLSDCKQS